MFESRVVLDGSQTGRPRNTYDLQFESRVVLDGSQTAVAFGWPCKCVTYWDEGGGEDGEDGEEEEQAWGTVVVHDLAGGG